MRALLRLAPVLLCLAVACGPEEGKGLALVEGQSLEDATGCYPDGSCPYVNDACVVVEYDTYKLPALCLPVDVCKRFTCAEGECRVYTGVPGQVKCVIP